MGPPQPHLHLALGSMPLVLAYGAVAWHAFVLCCNAQHCRRCNALCFCCMALHYAATGAMYAQVAVALLCAVQSENSTATLAEMARAIAKTCAPTINRNASLL